MNAKEYLENISGLEHKIKSLKIKAEQYEIMRSSLGGQRFDVERVEGGPINNDPPFVKFYILKCEVENKIKECEEELSDLRGRLSNAIEKIDNPDYQNILYMRYFNHFKWCEIANKLYVSEKTVRRWHEIAICLLNLQ